MDQEGLHEPEHFAALQGLARINWLSRSDAILWPRIERLARANRALNNPRPRPRDWRRRCADCPGATGFASGPEPYESKVAMSANRPLNSPGEKGRPRGCLFRFSRSTFSMRRCPEGTMS